MPSDGNSFVCSRTESKSFALIPANLSEGGESLAEGGGCLLVDAGSVWHPQISNAIAPTKCNNKFFVIVLLSKSKFAFNFNTNK